MESAKNTNKNICMHVVYHGRVQGVGFRVTVKHLATSLHITGTVRNTPDGSVEMVAQGEKSLLEKLLQAIQDEFRGYIDSVESQETTPSFSQGGFAIIP